MLKSISKQIITLLTVGLASFSAIAKEKNPIEPKSSCISVSEKTKAQRIKNRFLQEVAATSIRETMTWKKTVFREVYQFIPDKIYLMTEKPYEDRVAFHNSEEKRVMMEQVYQYLQKKYPGRLVHNVPIVKQTQRQADEILLCGRPVATIDTKRVPLRKAVDLCGMTQVGMWMDMIKAQNTEHKIYYPKGYKHDEIEPHLKYYISLEMMYGYDEYCKTVGFTPKKAINKVCPYSTEDFAGVSPSEKRKILKMFEFMPPEILNAPPLHRSYLIQRYEKVSSDKTGYTYIQDYAQSKRKKITNEYAAEVQKMCLEILLYRRPIALIDKKSTVENLISRCRYANAIRVYTNQGTLSKHTNNLEFYWEANAIKQLGLKWERDDFVQFAQKMHLEYTQDHKYQVSANSGISPQLVALKTMQNRL